jgi:hypothetical protein
MAARRPQRETNVLTRKIVVAGSALVTALAAAAVPAGADQSTVSRPDVVNSASDARPGQTVAKDSKGRTLVYVEGKQEQQLRAAVAKAGGTVAGSVAGRVKAAVPGDKLDVVASQPGVAEVRLPDRAVPMAVTSEGVALSKANQWIQDGKKGAGVKIGIIDVGFNLLADAQANGDLPTGSKLVVNNGNCIDAENEPPHGTAVAEIVHDMAPEASLYLACIEDTVSFAAAETWLRQQGVQVITAAIGFVSPTGGRGDGTGPAGSPADVVKRSREAGILWSVAAGNQARLHFAGKAADSNADSWVEFNGLTQNNGFALGRGLRATVGIRWDAWPTTNEDLDLYVMSDSHAPTGPNDPDIVAVSTRSQKDTPGGISPTEELSFVNPAGFTQAYYVYVKNNNARVTTPFELFVSGPDESAQLQAHVEVGSVTEPATSPYVMAVGATAPATGVVTETSGRGPTVDGRQKPDITAFEKVSTFSIGQLAGTSAAAAHVAGAAALLKSANPQLDAAQIQATLQNRASPKKWDNTWGNGTLNMGAPNPVPAVTGSGFTVAQSQNRLHFESYTPGQVKTLPIPNVPGDTTAVAIMVSGQSEADNIIDVTPGDPAASASSATGLRVRGDNTWVTTTMFVPLGPDRAVRIRSRNSNTWVVIDYLGYFSPSGSTDTYFPTSLPRRVLDTRGFAGSPRTAPLAAQQTQEVQIRGVAGVPANANAAVVNLTAFEATAQAFVSAYGDNNNGLTAIALNRAERRSNLMVVPIGADGKIRVFNNGDPGQVGVSVDLLGWFGPGAGAKYVTLPEATRLADTTTGNGLAKAPIGQGQSAQVQVGGLAGISSAATTAALLVTGTDNNLGTDLSVRPAEAAWSPVTDISTRKTEPAAGLVLARLGNSGKVNVRNDRGQATVSVDAAGYFIGGTKADPASVGNCTYPGDGPGFNNIFDGRQGSDMEGWHNTGTQRLQVDGCELATTGGRDITWYGAHTYNNEYTLKLDFKSTTDTADSGVHIMMREPGVTPSLEVSVGPRGATDTTQTGSIVGFQRGTAPQLKPTGEWNTMEIVVRWNTVSVKVNGFNTVEYTTTDQARTNRNSYIGLENHGTSSQVRYRNVRIKRDTPVYSGAVIGQNDRCVDILNGDPQQTSVIMWPCAGNFAQTWLSPGDGTLQGGGKCLTSKDYSTAENNPVILTDCLDNDSQHWLSRQDGRIVNPRSGRCLTPTSGDQGAQLKIATCGAQPGQIWRTPNQNAVAGKVVGPGGWCLDVANNNPVENKAVVWHCNGEVAQTWIAPGDGTLRGAGKCLDIWNASHAEDSLVNLGDCAGHWAQQWIAQPDGKLLNPVTGKCLGTRTADAGAELSIMTCGAHNRQTWRTTAESLSRGPIVGLATKCIDVVGDDPNGSELWLYECFGASGQLWQAPGDGTLRIYRKCLDVDALTNMTPIKVLPCDGSDTQQWSTRHDGTVVNLAANRCVDVLNNGRVDGTDLVIVDCHRAPNQRWSTAVNAS